MTATAGDRDAAGFVPGEPRVTLLTRPACHLCGPVRAVVAEVCESTGDTWVEANVDADPDIRSEYGDQIPVVLVDGKFLAAYGLRAEDLRSALSAR